MRVLELISVTNELEVVDIELSRFAHDYQKTRIRKYVGNIDNVPAKLLERNVEEISTYIDPNDCNEKDIIIEIICE